MTLIRNGVPNFELALKGIQSMLPEELREPYTNGINACTNAGILIETLFFRNINSLNHEKRKFGIHSEF